MPIGFTSESACFLILRRRNEVWAMRQSLPVPSVYINEFLTSSAEDES